VGFIDIPADVGDSVSFDIPFGGIEDGATLVVLKNDTDQDF
jgi:hypothetical protein